MKKSNFFASLKSLKKGVGAGSGSISQRYGSEDPDYDPHQNIGSGLWSLMVVSSCLILRMGWRRRRMVWVRVWVWV
jgi:hypothetical protein